MEVERHAVYLPVAEPTAITHTADMMLLIGNVYKSWEKVELALWYNLMLAHLR